MRYAALALCALALLAGCSFGWSGPAPASDGATRYNVTNAESTEQVVAVGVVDGPVDSLDLRFENGTARTVSPPLPETPAEPQSAVYALRNVSAVGVPGLGERESLALSSGESALGNVTVARGETVVFVARHDGSVGAVALARCGGEERMFSADFLVGSYGPAVGIGCTGS